MLPQAPQERRGLRRGESTRLRPLVAARETDRVRGLPAHGLSLPAARPRPDGRPREEARRAKRDSLSPDRLPSVVVANDGQNATVFNDVNRNADTVRRILLGVDAVGETEVRFLDGVIFYETDGEVRVRSIDGASAVFPKPAKIR